MGFDIAEERRFKSTVGIKLPAGLDKFDNQAITCEYLLITKSVMEATIKSGGDKAVLKTILKGVEGFTDSQGEPLYLDDGLIDAICDRDYLLSPIINTYYSRIRGEEPALKNA